MVRILAVALACLACASSGRRARSRAQAGDTDSNSLEQLLRFLRCLNPTFAFSHPVPRLSFPVSRLRKDGQFFMSAKACSPPVGRPIPHKVAFGKVAGEDRGANPMEPPIELVDDYFWLGDKEELARNPSLQKELDGLLKDENTYTLSRTDHLEAFRNELFAEMCSRTENEIASQSKAPGIIGVVSLVAFGILELAQKFSDSPSPLLNTIADVALAAAALSLVAFGFLATKAVEDVSAPPMLSEDGYEYSSRRGLAGSVAFVRRKPGGKEQVVLDVGQVSTSSFYVEEPGWKTELCQVLDVNVSPSGALLAYSVDGSGRERYKIRFKVLSTGVELDTEIPDTDGKVLWGDEATVFYLRDQKVWRHLIGTQPFADVLVYEETDKSCVVGIRESLDQSLIFIESISKDTSEVYFIPRKAPKSLPTLIRARQPGVEYTVNSHAPSQSLFIIVNGDGRENGELLVASLNEPSTWKPVVAAGTQVFAHSASRSLETAATFASFLVVVGRQDGLSQLWVVPLATTGAEASGNAHKITFDEDDVSPYLGYNLFDTKGKLQVGYTSMLNPGVLLEYDVNTRQFERLSATSGANYDPSLYKTLRTEVTARDGVAIPVTMMWRPDAVGNAMEAGGGGVPCHLYGYGAYGTSSDPNFDLERLSLVDRGVAYVIAHVRGGGEKGTYAWYQQSGKFLQKCNTFNDFVDVAEALLERGIAKPGALTCEGDSAGGLLIGSVVNMAPQLFTAALTTNPFVDLMVTMCDPKVALTTLEWEEWGNPNEAKYHDYMMSYSPIDNVRDGETYPSMLISSSLNDNRVGYWESAKWAQVLRSRIANGDDVLLMMDNAGHCYSEDTGAGLSSSFQVTAFKYAWLLDKLGKKPERLA